MAQLLWGGPGFLILENLGALWGQFMATINWRVKLEFPIVSLKLVREEVTYGVIQISGEGRGKT